MRSERIWGPMCGLMKIIYSFFSPYVSAALMILNTLFHSVFTETLWNGYSSFPFFRQEAKDLGGHVICSLSWLDWESTGAGIQTQEFNTLATCDRHGAPTA